MLPPDTVDVIITEEDELSDTSFLLKAQQDRQTLTLKRMCDEIHYLFTCAVDLIILSLK